MIPDLLAPPSPDLPHKNRTGITAREPDLNGWAEIKGNPISKVGVFPYLGKSIDDRLEPERQYNVLRPEEELSSPETMQSFRLLPWVDDHPNRLLGPEDAGRVPAEEKGIHGVIGEDIYFDEGVLYANIKIFTDDLADLIESGKRELSIGYGCRYELSSGIWNGIHYDAIQRSIRGNHLATVTEGRMGPDVAVLDHLKVSFDAKDIKMADEPDDKDEDMEVTAEQVSDFLKKFGKDYGTVKGIVDKHFGADANKENDMNKPGCDEDEEKKKEKESADKAAADKAAADKSAKDADEEKEKEKAKEKEAGDSKAALDAIDKLAKDVEDWKTNGTKKIMREIRQRDELAGQISGFVGSFDHAEMTLAEVAKYGADKLGLRVDTGHEASALAAYFHGRQPPAKQVGFAVDATEGKDSAQTSIADFYTKAA